MNFTPNLQKGKRKLKQNKTEFIPVDSEHFSIWYALKGINKALIDQIYLTASGGPLLKIPLNKINNLRIKDILKHPNWNMGKKISDSMNLPLKGFEGMPILGRFWI